MSAYEGHFARDAEKPWPVMTPKKARIALGLPDSDIRFIEGALSNAGVRTLSTESRSNKHFTLYCASDVLALADRVRER